MIFARHTLGEDALHLTLRETVGSIATLCRERDALMDLTNGVRTIQSKSPNPVTRVPITPLPLSLSLSVTHTTKENT